MDAYSTNRNLMLWTSSPRCERLVQVLRGNPQSSATGITADSDIADALPDGLTRLRP